MGDSELAKHQKYVWINSKEAILCWYDAVEGAVTQGKPPKKPVPTPYMLTRLVDAQQSWRVYSVISGGNISPGLWSVYALKPQDFLVLIIFILTLLLQLLSSFIWMPNLSESS